jgi:hypothetical protein
MIESRDHRAVAEPSSDDPRQEWRPPTLTVLGDARTLTENANLATFDGGLGSS